MQHRGGGGIRVLEPNLHGSRPKVRWERVLFFCGLAAALAILSSCGSSSTAVSASITASCISTQGSGSDVTVNGTAQCTATVLNASSTLVNWSVSGTGNGSIDTTSGLYTAPSNVPTNNVITITATSQVQSTLTATASVTIEAATAITAVICDDASGNQTTVVSSNNSLACTAFSSVSTGTTVPVNWTVANANNLGGNIGSISSQGVYTAPLVPPPGQMVTITATSKALASETMSVSVQAVFGSAVLNGQYAFSTTGRTTGKNFWARVGNLSAGGGTLSGLEDTNQGGSPNIVTTQRTFTGSYSINPDGRGVMQFCENNSTSCPMGSAAATSFFRIAVISPQQMQIIEFSSPTATAASITAGGEMILQDSAVYSARNGNLSGSYAFNFLGVTGSGTDESAIGQFTANGFGTISAGGSSTPGEIDVNPVPVGGSPAMLAGTSYAISSNGRGTVTLDGLTFSIYPVSAGRAKFIETDAGTTLAPVSILAGDAYIQQTSLICGWGLNSLNGSTVLETTGSSSNIVVQNVGGFTASAGAVSGGSLDQNSGGTFSSPPLGTLTGSYTMDPCGRGTLSFGTHSYVFYVISPSDAVLQEVTTGVVAQGLLMPSQGGPFMDSTLTGSYVFRLGGTDAAGTAGSREDLVGQFSSNGSGTGLAGTLDLNDFGVTQSNLVIANGTYAVPNGIRTTMTIPVATSPSTTRNLVLYMVSPTLFYVLDTDQAPAGTALGVINNQF